MTLLDSVKAFQRISREEEATAITDTLEDQTIVGLLNDAAQDVLGDQIWSFLKRYDGVAFLPAAFTATAGLQFGTGSVTGVLNAGGANSWGLANVGTFTSDVVSRLRATGDTSFPNTSYVIESFGTVASFTVTLKTPYRGAIVTSGPLEIYTSEYVFPATVRQVLSVWNEEEPLRVTFEDRDTVNREIPRQTDQFSENPEIASVGGLYTESQSGTSAVRTALGMWIWPPPDSDVQLQYSYVYRYPVLANETDAWTGVPSEFISLIEWTAFELALLANVEDDSERYQSVRGRNRQKLSGLRQADNKAPNRRYVPHVIGGGNGNVHPNARWSSRVVPSP